MSAVVDARSYVYFSAFDDADNSRNLMYRVCQVQGASYGLLYQECSTESGASGAGVYMQVYDLVQDHWDRVVSDSLRELKPRSRMPCKPSNAVERQFTGELLKLKRMRQWR